MNKKQPARTAQTRRDLMDAFWQLYCEKDIHRITVIELCRKAGYNRSTFYQYYTDVFQVLESLEEELVDEWEAMLVEQSREEGLPVPQMIAFYENRGEYVARLIGPQGDPAFRFRLQDALRPHAYALLGFQQGDVRQEIQYDYMFSGVLTLLTGWYKHREGISPEEVLAIARSIAGK